MKRGGGRRYYRPEDVELLRGVRRLLYEDGYTIKGVQKILREQGVRYVMDAHRADEDGLDARQARRQIPEVADDARRGVGARPHSQGGGGLSGQQRRQLDALLQELEACRKLLAAGRG